MPVFTVLAVVAWIPILLVTLMVVSFFCKLSRTSRDTKVSVTVPWWLVILLACSTGYLLWFHFLVSK